MKNTRKSGFYRDINMFILQNNEICFFTKVHLLFEALSHSVMGIWRFISMH